MKMNTWLRVALLLALVMMLGFGCAKKQVSQTPAATDSGQTTMTDSSAGTGSTADSAAEAQAMKEKELAEAMNRAKSELTSARIYFDFDKFDLKTDARDTLKAVAAVLKNYPSFRVLIEGHCDERGTEEYNLALGERRARAAYEFLVLLGVKASQLEIVSYGEERPAVDGSSEAVWAKNRRDEFKIIK